VSWLKKSLLLLLAALWLPAMSHCSLEQSIDLAFLACHSTAETDSHQSSDCEGDVCASLEDGFFRPEEGTVTVVAPTLLLTALIISLVAPEPTPVTAVAIPADTLSIGRNWQFACRTALPPRAPSSAS
jgi:hypothetical protein